MLNRRRFLRTMNASFIAALLVAEAQWAGSIYNDRANQAAASLDLRSVLGTIPPAVISADGSDSYAEPR